MKRITRFLRWSAVAACFLGTSAFAQDIEIAGSLKHTSEVMTMDGKADEAVWGATEEYSNFFTAANEPPDDDADLSVKWRGLWDDENLYVYAEVTDDANVVGDNNDWQDDSIELYIDAGGFGKDEGPSVMDYNTDRTFPVFQLTLVAGEIDLHGGINHEAWLIANDDVADMNAGTVADGTNYTYEFAIPWSTLGESTPAEIIDRGFFGLGMAVNDDDDKDGRDSQLMWATDSGELWHDATVFPNVALLFPEGPGPDIFLKGSQDLGQISVDAPTVFDLEVRNVGQENALTISSITVSGPSADLVTIGELASVAANSVGKLPVTLDTKGQTGGFEFTIEIQNDDVDPEDQTRSTVINAAVINFAGPAIHFAMDDGADSTTLRDITGYGRHGTLDGAKTDGEGLVAGGSSLSVSGGSQGVIPGGSISVTNFSVSMWFQASQLAPAQTLFSQGLGNPAFALLLQEGDLSWFADDAPQFSASGVAANTKYHVVGTYSAGDKAAIYLDGVEVASQDAPADVLLEAGDSYFIGAFDGGLDFSGLIDDVQFYDRTLTPEEVTSLFSVPGSVIQGEGFTATPDGDAVVLAADEANGYFAGAAGEGGDPGLRGSYWELTPKAVPTDLEPLHRAGDGGDNSGWVDENIYGTERSGTFTATTFDFGGNDLTPIKEWLKGDADSFSGQEGVLDDGVFRMQGLLYAAQAGNQEITFTSDDGSVLYVADQLVINNDNGHGDTEVKGKVFFPEPGYYPIDIRYFNGDWTNEGGDHGGANFVALGLDNVFQGDAPAVEPPGPGDVRGDLGAVAESSGALTESAVVDFGALSGDATYEFSFNAIKAGASTAIAGNDSWGLKLDQWNEQGVFGTTEFGVADHIFTALDGQSVESVFGRDVHVVIVSDATNSETRLYIDGTQVGRIDGSFELAGEVSVMAARVAAPVDFMGEGSVMHGWATYNNALADGDIATLASTPFGTDPVDLPPLAVSIGADGAFNITLSDGVTGDVQYSTDLISWETIASGVSGTVSETDAGRIAAPAGYYRATQ